MKVLILAVFFECAATSFLARHYSLPRRRRLSHISLRPLLITSERLIDGRQQLSQQILMEKFLPKLRKARPNKNATMQNKWLL